MWTVEWKDAELNLAKERKSTTGALRSVSGTIYRAGQVAAIFTADTAYADGPKNQLQLKGHVKVYSHEQKTTLTCDRMIFFPDRDIVEATGNVRFDLPTGQIEGLKKVLATSDLKSLGTPDLFQKP